MERSREKGLTEPVCDEGLAAHPEFVDLLRDLARESVTWPTFQARVKPLHDAANALMAAKTEAMPRVTFLIQRGDVVLFDHGMIHGALPIKDPARTRKIITAEWQARSVQSFLMTAYWGSAHDHRCTANAWPDSPVIESPFGAYRIHRAGALIDRFPTRPIILS